MIVEGTRVVVHPDSRLEVVVVGPKRIVLPCRGVVKSLGPVAGYPCAEVLFDGADDVRSFTLSRVQAVNVVDLIGEIE